MTTAHVLKLIDDSRSDKSAFDAEMSRRRFWACHLINCHSSDSMFAISPQPNLDALLLPCRENEFDNNVQRGLQTTFGSGSSNGGVYSELVRAMSHW